MKRLLALAAVAACGDNTAPPVPHDGSRLKLVDYVFEGVRITSPSTFYDTELEDFCAPTVFSDRGRYCMPQSAGGQTVFVDRDCRTPVGLDSSGNDAPPRFFIGSFTLNGETLPSRLYVPTVRIEAPASIWKSEDGNCVGPSPLLGGDYYALIEQISRDDLARVHERGRMDGENLKLGVLAGDDGFLSFGSWYDTTVDPAGALCDPAPTTAPSAPTTDCIPRELPRAQFYSDPACEEPAVASRYGNVVERAVFLDPQRTGCRSLRFVSGFVDPSEVYGLLGTSCVRQMIVSGTVVYRTTVAAGLTLLRREPRPGSSRLSPIDLVSGELDAPTLELADATLETDCHVEIGGDGIARCVPNTSTATQVATVFADPACSTPIQLAFMHEQSCDVAPPAFTRDGDTLYAIGGPYLQPFYERDTGDTCSTLAAPPGYTAYQLGTPIAPDAFARATVAVQR